MTDWIMTYTGRAFYPTEPRIEDIVIEDIAHALAHVCRFAGHTRSFYSVAQHSVLVADECPESMRLYALLHDASEAYLGDVPRPLKRLSEWSDYRGCEDRLKALIYARFGLPEIEPKELKIIDRRMLRTEQRDLMPPAAYGERRDDVEPYAKTITPWRPDAAERIFTMAFWKSFESVTV